MAVRDSQVGDTHAYSLCTHVLKSTRPMYAGMQSQASSGTDSDLFLSLQCSV